MLCSFGFVGVGVILVGVAFAVMGYMLGCIEGRRQHLFVILDFGIGISHKPSLGLRCPLIINWLFFVMIISFLSNVMSHPSSHNCPIDIRLELFRSGNIMVF